METDNSEAPKTDAQQHELIKRRDAAQALLDKWQGESFRMGERDCVRMMAEHVRRMGHSVKLPPEGSYRTALGAVRKLRELGHASLADAIDSLGLERIAPASALTGDLIELRGETDDGDEAKSLTALTVAMGNGRVLGFHEVGCVVMQPLEYLNAWRVVPK